MAGVCPAPGPGDPLVESLAASTDCHLQALVQASYATLFAPGGALATTLTVGLTIYVALVGYQLMLGRGGFSVSGFAVSAIKIGAVLALATQWPIYEALVYGVLFRGPQEVAEAVLRAGGARSGDLLAHLQQAVDTLSLFSPADPPGPLHRDPNAAAALPSSIPQLMTPASFDAFLLLASASTLLLTTLGLLVAAKIVLGVLLALGPIFIALFLFDSTRGLFVGWMRATLGAALLPLLGAIVTALALVILQPSLDQVQQMSDSDTYIPGVAMRVFVMVAVVVLTSGGLALAAGVTAFGLRIPSWRPARSSARSAISGPAAATVSVTNEPGRSGRIASAIERQDGARALTSSRGRDPAEAAAVSGEAEPRRLGSELTRRAARPRERRSRAS